MARVSVYTLLPVDTWRAILGIDPWVFNQISSPTTNDNQCQTVFYQQPYYYDYLSREEIAQAIDRAEMMAREYLGFDIAPRYNANEHLQPTYRYPYQRHWQNLYYWQPYWQYGVWWAAQTRYGKVLGGGVLGRTSIGDAAITLSDPNNDGVDELFTLTIATTLTDPYEIGVYFTATDRNNVPVDETWRIRPVTVSISGGIATITGHASLLVKPNLTTVVNPQALDVSDVTIYVTDLSVYRVFRDYSAGNVGTAYWNPRFNCDVEPCTMQTQDVQCVGDIENQTGIIAVGYGFDGACYNWRQPDKININYLAGEPLVNGNVNSQYAYIIAYLATGLLPQGSCGCDRSDRIIAYWRQDVTEENREVRARPLTPKEAECPWGFTRGALWAWNRVSIGRDIIQGVGL